MHARYVSNIHAIWSVCFFCCRLFVLINCSIYANSCTVHDRTRTVYPISGAGARRPQARAPIPRARGCWIRSPRSPLTRQFRLPALACRAGAATLVDHSKSTRHEVERYTPTVSLICGRRALSLVLCCFYAMACSCCEHRGRRTPWSSSSRGCRCRP